MIQVTRLNDNAVYLETHKGDKFILERRDKLIRAVGNGWSQRVAYQSTEHLGDDWPEIAMTLLPFFAQPDFDCVSFF
jgi:hypothetical protein